LTTELQARWPQILPRHPVDHALRRNAVTYSGGHRHDRAAPASGALRASRRAKRYIACCNRLRLR
ncbi:MAG: hypothetical protein MI741_02905, partial [Rhodospirillales bacterium]|nr:hypothetical protein [Rhodospirillales bacterium]